MKLNWKDSFKEKRSNKLFEIFSEKNRINIEPQIFAGNLLFERKYELEKLKIAKKELIESIEDNFKKKYNLESKEIKKENVIKEIIFRTILSVIIFVIFYKLNSISFSIFSININNKTFAIILSLISFIPLFWIKKSNEEAIDKVQKAIEKKNNLIKKIETELMF